MTTTTASEQSTMTQPVKLLYTAKAHTTGGREGGASRTSDGRLEVKLSVPGGPGTGTNPEQLFAVGWSACFLSAIKLVAAKMRVKLAADPVVDPEVDLFTGLLSQGSSQRKPAGFGSPGRAVHFRHRASNVPLLQGHAREYRSRD